MTEGAFGPASADAPVNEVAPLDTEGSACCRPSPPRCADALVARAVGACSGIAMGGRAVVHAAGSRVESAHAAGVPPGRSIEAFWDGHRVAGEEWGEGPPVYLVHGWGGQRAHLAVFVQATRGGGVSGHRLRPAQPQRIGSRCPGTGPHHRHRVRRRDRGHDRDPRASACGRRPLTRSQLDCSGSGSGAPVGRLVFLAPMGEFPLYSDLFAARHGFGRRIRAGLHRRPRPGLGATARDEPDVERSTGEPPAATAHPRPRRSGQSLCRQCERVATEWPVHAS